jgi:microcystin-dependent protein
MKTLHIMSMDFLYKAAIRGYQSAILERVWNGIGSLELHINSGIPNANLIKEDDLLWFDQEYGKVHVVEKIETTQDGSEKLLKIVASHINVLLKDFVTIPPAGSDYDIRFGTREEVARSWVEQNAIHPENPNRVQYPIVLGEIRGLGGVITEQTRLKVLSDEITRILSPGALGWGLTLDIPNRQYRFDVQEGINRTAAQTSNSRVLFGIHYGNLAGYRKIKDLTVARTVAFIGGAGEGAQRNIIEVDAAGSGRRKETFVDARDVKTDEELIERGLQALYDTAEADSYEFEALDRQFLYEVDYDLGDLVTIVTDKSTYQDLQIQMIREIYEQGNRTVIPSFGIPERTIGKAISAVARKLESLENASLKLDDDTVTTKATWSSEKIIASIPPAGTIVATAAEEMPAGWLECAGQTVSRIGYAALFTAIGTAFGSGDGSTTFHLPNLKGRIPVGLDASQVEFDTLGETGGSKTHALTVEEMPSHSHGQRAISNNTAGTAGIQGGSAASTTTIGSTVAAGGGIGHNNLQPYLVLRYMIKF